MDESGGVSAAGKHRRRYFVAVMLLLMVTLGYVDRVNMSVAGPPSAKSWACPLEPWVCSSPLSSGATLPCWFPWGG